MIGKHHVMVETNHIRYDFNIQRNITVIQGDSATGKTTLVELLRLYAQRGTASGVRVQADVRCRVYAGAEDEWEQFIGQVSKAIIFIDEDYNFIFTKEFAESIRYSDNYYVLITRRPLYYLPVSVNEIYGIRTSGKYHFPEKVYQEFYCLYPMNETDRSVSGRILVEDSRAGFRFYSSVGDRVECISAGGNANIYKKIQELNDGGDLLVIADGAAFGAYIEKVLSLIRMDKHMALYLPESFEWMILKSGIFEDTRIKDILESPYEYIESTLYFSWEQFFEKVLVEISEGVAYAQYDKSNLRDFYLTEKSKKKIIDVMPESLRLMWDV